MLYRETLSQETNKQTNKNYTMHRMICLVSTMYVSGAHRGWVLPGAGVRDGCEPLWVLGAKLRSSAGAVSVPNL